MPIVLPDLEKRRIGDKFFSRKNSVFKSLLDGKPVVVKVFARDAADKARKEYSILGTCKDNNIAVPTPFELEDSVIVMEHVKGPTLAEFLDAVWHEGTGARESSCRSLDQVSTSLGAWLADFHAVFDRSLTRGDANIRNFLIGEGGIVGIDFEESGESDVLEDLGQALSSILSMRPMFTEQKVDFCRRIVEAYISKAGVIETACLNEAIASALENYAPFRSDGESMISRAAEVRRSGIWSDEE